MTLAELIARTRADQLHEYPPLNVLDGAIDADDINLLVLRAAKTLVDGTRLSIDLEDLHVWEVSGQAVGVLRGHAGTTATTHADGAVVLVGPRFSNAQILRAVNEELQSLTGEGLYRPVTLALTSDAVERSYDLTGVTDILGLVEVRVDDTSPSNEWPTVPAYLDRDALTSEFASGNALMLRTDVEPGRPLRVTYKSSFGSLSALDDDVEDETGLWPEAHDILQIGAATRLMAGTEISRARLNSQSDTRRATEVPPGTALQAVRGLLAEREMRVAAERSRLRMRYPMPVRTW